MPRANKMGERIPCPKGTGAPDAPVTYGPLDSKCRDTIWVLAGLMAHMQNEPCVVVKLKRTERVHPLPKAQTKAYVSHMALNRRHLWQLKDPWYVMSRFYSFNFPPINLKYVTWK